MIYELKDFSKVKRMFEFWYGFDAVDATIIPLSHGGIHAVIISERCPPKCKPWLSPKTGTVGVSFV